MRAHFLVCLAMILIGSFISFPSYAGCQNCDIKIISGPKVEPELKCVSIEIKPQGSCVCDINFLITNKCTEDIKILSDGCIHTKCDGLEQNMTVLLRMAVDTHELNPHIWTFSIAHAGVSHDVVLEFEATSFFPDGIGCGGGGTSDGDGSHLGLFLFLTMTLGLFSIRRFPRVQLVHE